MPKNEWFYQSLISGEIKKDIYGVVETKKHYTIIFNSPGLSRVKQLTKLVSGRCAKNTPLKDIPLGERLNFKAGDPRVFCGVATEVVKFYGSRFLKITLSDDTFAYVRVVGRGSNVECYSLEVVKKRQSKEKQ